MCMLYVCVVVILYVIVCAAYLCECMCAVRECVHARWVYTRMLVNIVCSLHACVCCVCWAVLLTPEVGNVHVVLSSLETLQDKVQLLIFQEANPSLAQTFHSPCLPIPLGSPGLRQPLAGTQRALILAHS